MPAVRLSRRRRSSHAIFTPAKPGIYGIPARPVTFAPNVTPVTFVDSDDLSSNDDPASAGSPTATLFPPSETPAPPPTRKRCPPGKRRSQGYIPRPPNAFMLFRADFVRQKHVPGSIETNHGSLSKIIGTCWRQLPLEEKRIWEVKAKQEKANHKAMFPDYRFRPVHNKNKNGGVNDASAKDADPKRKEKQPTTMEDERRCEEVAQLLLEGKKGEELAMAVRHLDRERERELELELGLEMGMGLQSRRDSYGSESQSVPVSSSASPMMMPMPLHMPLPMGNIHVGGMHNSSLHKPSSMGMYHRRSSSVPLPNDFFANFHPFASSSMSPSPDGIALPSVPFMSRSGAASPVRSISRQQQFLGQYNQQQQQFGFQNPFQQQGQFQFSQQQGFQQTQHSFESQGQFSNPFQNSLQALQGTTPTAFSFGAGHPTLSQRNSLGQRRASSAQPMLMRSWTMPMSSYDTAQPHMQMERDHSPLPDVDPGLFADFSFGGNPNSASATSSSSSEVDPVSGTPDVSLSASSSHPSSAYSGSPPPPDMPLNAINGMQQMDMSAYMHLDTLYPTDQMYGGLDPMYASHIDEASIDPIARSMNDSSVDPHGSVYASDVLHAPKPQHTPTEQVFSDIHVSAVQGHGHDIWGPGAGGEERGADGLEGYFEPTAFDM